MAAKKKTSKSKKTKKEKKELSKAKKKAKKMEEEVKEKVKKNNSKKSKEIAKKSLSETGFLKTGVPGFDDLFGKGYGIPEGAAVLVEGGPGSGKTIFSLATMNELCKKGKKCLYMSFEEPKENLVEHMEHFGWPAKKYLEKGLLKIENFSALDVSRSIEALLSAAKKELLIEVDPVLFPKDFDPDFIVIDSLTAIASAFSGQQSRFRIYMEQLFNYLEKHNITNFLIREVSAPSHIGTTFQEQGEAVSFLSDGIIVLYNVIYSNGKRSNGIEVLKMRGSNIKKKIVKMEIKSKKGVYVYPDKIISEDKASFRLT